MDSGPEQKPSIANFIVNGEISRLEKVRNTMGDAEWAESVGQSMVPCLLFKSNEHLGPIMEKMLDAIRPMAKEIRKRPELLGHFIDGMFDDLQDRRVWPSERAAE